MMRLIVLMIAVFTMLHGRAAQAEDCTGDGTQLDLNQCAADNFAASDAELNALYKQVRQRLRQSPDSASQLVVAQKAWIAFRDAECDFNGINYEGGSMQPMIIWDCRNRLTRLRADDFKRYLACGEDDCPVPPAR